MKVFLGAALAAAFAGSSLAEGYSDHKGVRIFTEKPCHYVTTYFDDPDTDDEIVATIQSMAIDQSTLAMAWGFILGFDYAEGGLWDGETTTLERFRAACEADPLLTGAEILHNLAAD